MNFKPLRILKRCKSECDVSHVYSYDYPRDSRYSESSYTESEGDKREDEIAGLEKKIDRLNDLFAEHCTLLAEVKEELKDSKTMIEKAEQAQNIFIAEFLKKALVESSSGMQEPLESEDFNRSARSLLNAIETKPLCLEQGLKDALADFLQSKDLREHMVSATAKSLHAVVRGCVSRDVSRLYLPLLQREQKRLARQLSRALDDGFAELEANSAQLSSSMCRVSRSLQRALERHQALLETNARLPQLHNIIEETLRNEMQQWRQEALNAVCAPDYQHDSGHYEQEWAQRGATPPLEIPDSPPQPVKAGTSIIDQLMETAEINKEIQEGDVNSAFERALSAADLSLVMAACRAADPSRVFTPCRLRQHTLLSLAQQLTTDMVHDTQLKCRYLEEALINLNPIHPATRAHLPLVVSEVRKHLTNFLSNFPSHIANRRIMLIIMAADNLLK